jgi:NADH-quinone oxidoreductase subunit C
MDEKLTVLAERLAAALPDAVQRHDILHGELSVRIARDAVTQVLTHLRDDPQCRFTVLCDICGVDYPDRPMRFEVVYNLLSMSQNLRIRLKVETDEESPVPSATGIFNAAGWWER